MTSIHVPIFISVILATCALPLSAGAQDGRSIGATVGIHYGYWTRAELGMAFATEVGVHSKWGYSGLKLTGVIETADAHAAGVEIGYWINGLIALGANLGYYVDETHHQVIFRPDIGIGGLGVRLVYGYNIGSTIRGVPRHEVSLVGYIPAIEFKRRGDGKQYAP